MPANNGDKTMTLNFKTIRNADGGTELVQHDKPTARNAIRTRYSGTSSTVSATANGKRIRVGYDHALDATANHAAAAQAYLDEHNEFETKLVPNGLCFDNDYFWTWSTTGPRKAAA